MTKLIDPIDCAATRGAAKQAAESHKSMLPTAEADQVTEGDELLALATSIEEQNSGVGPGYNVAILARPYIWKKVVDVLRLASTSSTRLPVGLTQELMNSTTVSCSGLDITIACNDHDTKEALMDLLVDGAFAAPPSPSQGAEREVLRRLVDVVWNEATESTAVPSTKWSDKLIDRVFPALPLAEPSDTKRGEPNFLAIALQIIHGTGGDPKRKDEAAEVLRVAFATPLPVKPDTKVREALEAAQKVLAILIDPKMSHVSSLHVWAQAVDAEKRARTALSDQGGR